MNIFAFSATECYAKIYLHNYCKVSPNETCNNKFVENFLKRLFVHNVIGTQNVIKSCR